MYVIYCMLDFVCFACYLLVFVCLSVQVFSDVFSSDVSLVLGWNIRVVAFGGERGGRNLGWVLIPCNHQDPLKGGWQIYMREKDQKARIAAIDQAAKTRCPTSNKQAYVCSARRRKLLLLLHLQRWVPLVSRAMLRFGWIKRSSISLGFSHQVLIHVQTCGSTNRTVTSSCFFVCTDTDPPRLALSSRPCFNDDRDSYLEMVGRILKWQETLVTSPSKINSIGSRTDLFAHPCRLPRLHLSVPLPRFPTQDRHICFALAQGCFITIE